MHRTIAILGIYLSFSSLCFAQGSQNENLTITTYYPSPYGVYNQLQTNSLGVGDNDNSGKLDSGDVPTTAGDAWIKGKVGIGTNNPQAKLAVVGDCNITGDINVPSNRWGTCFWMRVGYLDSHSGFQCPDGQYLAGLNIDGSGNTSTDDGVPRSVGDDMWPIIAWAKCCKL